MQPSFSLPASKGLERRIQRRETRHCRVENTRERMTENQLIRLASDGDGPAIRSLYERYAPRVYAVVRRIAGDDDLAQD